MDWTMVGAIGEVVGGLGVVASLVYVGSQVRSNTAALHAEAFRTCALASVDLASDWARDSEWSQTLSRLSVDGATPDDFDESQRTWIALHLIALARVQEVGFVQFRRGRVPAEILELADSAVFRTSYFKAGWPGWRGEFSEEFRLYMDEQLEFSIDPAQP